MKDGAKTKLLVLSAVTVGIAALSVAGIFGFKLLTEEDKNTEKPTSSVSEAGTEQSTVIKPFVPKKKPSSNSPNSLSASTSQSAAPSKTESSEETAEPSSTEEQATAKPKTNIVKVYSLEKALYTPKSDKLTYYDQSISCTLPYRLYLPENFDGSKKYPVLLFLHGAGEIGTDNSSHLNNFKPAFSIAGDLLSQAIVISPQANGWWTLDYSPSGYLTAAMHLTEEVIEKYSGDRDRIYVTGLSMGGYATWDLLANYSGYFAAAVPVCGGGNTYAAGAMKNTPIWIYHGTEDTTVSYNQSLRMYNAIKNAGGNRVKLITLEGVAHNAWHNAYSDRSMFCWMFAQNKQTNQSVEGPEAPFISVTDHNGNILFTDKQIQYATPKMGDADYYIELGLEYEAFKSYKNTFERYSDKIFTLYFCGQRVYDFKATGELESGTFRIEKVMAENEYFELLIALDNFYFK